MEYVRAESLICLAGPVTNQTQGTKQRRIHLERYHSATSKTFSLATLI